MAPGWSSPILNEWTESPQRLVLSADDELRCAERIKKGCDSRRALLQTLAPLVAPQLTSSADATDAIPLAARTDLSRRIVDAALDSCATSHNPAKHFFDLLEKAFRDQVTSYFDRRRKASSDFWVNDETWFDEHLDLARLGKLLEEAVLSATANWADLADAGRAIASLVEHGLAVVPNVVAHLDGHGLKKLSQEDAENEAVVAIRRIAWKFDGSVGTRFHEFAYQSVKNHLRSKIRTSDGRTEDLAKKLGRLSKAEARLWVSEGKRPTREAVLANIEEWGKEAKASLRRVLEVSDPVPSDWDGTLDLLPSRQEELPDGIAADRDRDEIVRRALLQLSPRPLTVVTCLIFHGMTNAAAAREMNVSIGVFNRLKDATFAELRSLCKQLAHDD